MFAIHPHDSRKSHYFEPFLADLNADLTTEDATPKPEVKLLDSTDVDTVVVPAQEEGFRDVFLGENRWYAVRIHGTMRPQIKYIAGYQVAPIQAITHIAPVKSIAPWKDSDKVVLDFAEPAKEIGPIALLKGGHVKGLQNLHYTTRKRLETAKTLDDVW